MDTPDLRPRTITTTAPDAAPTRRKRRPWAAGAVLGVALMGGAIILFQGLSNATVYFCNADEVGVRSDCQPGKRFRLQGTVDAGSVVDTPRGIDFTVTFAGATIPVTYGGEPGGIFKEGIPVVVEGRMGQTGTFDGDRILVKHTEQYREENPDRVPPGAP